MTTKIIFWFELREIEYKKCSRSLTASKAEKSTSHQQPNFNIKSLVTSQTNNT